MQQVATVITDHRMAFSISTTQTVLWDQIRYSGDASQFAWVLPVGHGARVELAQNDWLAALDALTAPVIKPPTSLPARCQTGFGGGGGGGGGGCGFSAANESFGGDTPGAFDATAAMFDSGNGVQVVSQEVVGPYDAVTIRSTNGGDISLWLTGNGFDIPPNIQPILDAYTNEGFDFIALKLAPNQGVQAMQPVRVITPGADPTLPLRMVSAGIGSSVGITLFVIAEGRYETANFVPLLIDPAAVTWDQASESSNYTTLFNAAIADGKGWVTESAGSASTLSSAYMAQCVKLAPVPAPCPVSDGGVSEGGASDSGITDASTDGGDGGDAAVVPMLPEAGACTVSACTQFTDYDVATAGMHPYDVQVTRLRTTLPALALSVDLKLRASAQQSPVGSLFQATEFTTDPCPQVSSAPPTKDGSGCNTANQSQSFVATVFGALGVALLRRRRRR